MFPGGAGERRGNFFRGARGIEAWLGLAGFPRFPPVIAFLRLAGLATAGVWLGGTVLFVFLVDPLFGRAEFVRLLGPLHAGEAGFVAAERFQMFQVLCASLAVVVTLADWLYSGRPLDKRIIVLLAVLLALASAGRLWLVPKCRQLNLHAYLGPGRQVLRQPITPAQHQAENSLAVWEGVGVVANVVSLVGTGLFFLQAASPSNAGPRLFPRNRLRI